MIDQVKRHPVLVWVAVAVAAVAAGFVIYASPLTRGTLERPDTAPDRRPTPTPTLYTMRALYQPGDLERRRGETATLDDLAVTVLGGSVVRRSDSTYYKAGWYVDVRYRVRNTASEPVTYHDSGVDWSVEVPTDPPRSALWDEFEVIGAPGRLEEVRLGPGESAEGVLPVKILGVRAPKPRGSYYAVWHPATCEFHVDGDHPIEPCRAVWLVARG